MTHRSASSTRIGRLAPWLGCVLACALSACGGLPQPWEKGILAKPEMSFDGDALEARFTDHIYTSKEAATGGGAVGGAGCGCN